LYRTSIFAVMLFAACLLTLCVFQSGTIDRQLVRGADDSQVGSNPVPVESDMHEFMEYVFQPT
jgi:hypothetical protein